MDVVLLDIGSDAGFAKGLAYVSLRFDLKISDKQILLFQPCQEAGKCASDCIQSGLPVQSNCCR